MTQTCIRTPISWLDLERYALEDMAASERAALSEHLEACEACRSCMDHLESREPIALPALPAAPELPWWRRPFVLPAFAAAAVGVAVVLLLVLRSTPGPQTAAVYPPQRVGVKGGDLAIELVRESGTPDIYESGDRFKVLVTCPPGYARTVEIAVFQDGEAFSPIPGGPIECGNRVSVPGAFRVTGSTPVYVCAALDAPALDPGTLAERGASALGKKTVCTPIKPAQRR